MRQRPLFVAAVVALALTSSCGPPSRGDGGDGGGGGDPCGGCPPDQVCVPDLGCRECVPGQVYCGGDDDNTVFECNSEGTGGNFVGECLANQVCFDGECLAGCEAAERTPSNVGCHFWAVDLDNENDAVSDASAQQFAVLAANTNDYEITVSVYQNQAAFGEPPSEQLVATTTVSGNDLARIDLPQREVDGQMGQNGSYARGGPTTSGTFVSSHAFRIESSGPIVAYQFQPIIQQFSNDASILIPRQALGRHYTIFGWPSAVPCAPLPGDTFYIEGKPDYTFLTIVGAEEDTHVTVVPTHPIKASIGPSGMEIPMTPAGMPLELVIGPYDVVNLESELLLRSFFDCPTDGSQNGDFTGSIVTSDKRVSVFSGVEASNSFGGATPPMPPYENRTCCTDHLEEQMLPTTALGWKFAVSRSPVRSPTSWEEPDLYRVLATDDGTLIRTNLAPPYDQFTLNGGEFKAFHSFTGFTLESFGGAIMVGQVLVSQGQAGPWPMEGEPQGIGDPSLTIFPAIDQYRSQYVFLVPGTWELNYMVLALPATAGFTLDGITEFPPECEERAIGVIDGVDFKQITCALREGVHHVTTTEPSGLTVYGYYDVGSYSYPGGSDVNIINPID